MSVQVHLLTYNEEKILPFTFRHYLTFADRIIIHDAYSTDATRPLASIYGAAIIDWDTKDEFNDQLAKELKSTCWIGTEADWVIVADADELIYFPHGAKRTLAIYDANDVEVVSPWGWEMYSEKFPTTEKQIYDEIKVGARDDKWYSKPILFSPKRVKSLKYSGGAHQVIVSNVKGQEYKIDNVKHKFTEPPTYLLHCKHIYPIEDIAAAYDARRKRLSEINVRQRWGNFEPGTKHAQDKRNMILSKLEQIPL